MTSIETIIGIIASVMASCGALLGAVRWLVRAYLHELVPNSGKSIKDQINHLNQRIDDIYHILLEKK